MSNNGTHIFIAMQLAKYRRDDLLREARTSQLARRARRRGRRTPTDE